MYISVCVFVQLQHNQLEVSATACAADVSVHAEHKLH
jgi:hypothetical protein